MAKRRTLLAAAAVLIGAAVLGGAAWKGYVIAPRQQPVVEYRLPDPPGYQESLPKQPAAEDPIGSAEKPAVADDAEATAASR